jgi:hypothetical protein
VSYAEVLIGTLIKWVQETGEQPTEISLPTPLFLNVAADLQDGRIYADAVNHLPLRTAWRRPKLDLGPDRNSNALRDAVREVRVGDTFVVQGPRGAITVREAKTK